MTVNSRTAKDVHLLAEISLHVVWCRHLVTSAEWNALSRFEQVRIDDPRKTESSKFHQAEKFRLRPVEYW
jgi:hypothetical protein